MANLKNTLVLGKLTATDSIIANKFIIDSTASDKILMGDGSTKSFTNDIADKFTEIDNNKTNKPTSDINKSDYQIIVYPGENSNNLYYRSPTSFIQDLGLSQVYNYKGTLADLNALKSITSARVGDVYFISATNDSWACKQKVTAATGDNHTTYWNNLGSNVDLSGYVTKDTAQTITGNKTFTGNVITSNNKFEIKANSNTDDSWIKLTNATDAGYYAFGIRRPYDTYGLQLKIHPTTGSDTYYDIWHAGNDGAGSGLDADTLDGLEAAAFPQCDGTGATGTWSISIAGNATTSSYPAGFSGKNSGGWGTLITANGYEIITDWQHNGNATGNTGGDLLFASKGGQISMQVDGYFYQNEGGYRVFDVSGGTIDGAVKILAADPKDTQPALLKVLSTSDALSGNRNWTGRMMVGAKNLTFLMGTYNGMAGLGAHSWTDSSKGTNANWAPLYIQPDGSFPVYIGANGKSWDAGTGTLIVEGNNTTANAGSVTVNGSLSANGATTLNSSLTVSGNITASGTGTQDFTAGTLKFDTINIPTSNGGTTYGTGSSNQVLKANGSGQVYWGTDNNTTYTFTSGTNGFTVSPDGGTTVQNIDVNPSIENNITGQGESQCLAKFYDENTLTSGPELGSDTNLYLRNDGGWDTPPNTWQANTSDQNGYVTATGGATNANKVWKVGSNGTPGWGNDDNTDTLVKQTKLGTSGTTKYPILASKASSPTSANSYEAYYASAITITGGGTLTASSFNATSDRRLKHNIIDFTPQHSILDLPIYKFDFINGAKNQIGCLAQDLQQICPEIVNEDGDGYLSIQEGKIVYLLIDEIKKLKDEINELKGGR